MLKVKTYLIVVHIAGWLLFFAFPLLFLNGSQNNISFVLLQSPFYWLFGLTYIFLFYFNAYFLIPKLYLNRLHLLYALITLVLFTGVCFLRPYDKLVRSNDSHQNFFRDRDDMFKNDRFMEGDMPRHHRNHLSADSFSRGPFSPGELSRHRWGGGLQGGLHFNRHHYHVDLISLFLFMMIMALSTAIRIIQQWRISEQRAVMAEADKISAELSFLKAQINPHFLFNTLNNIYTLAVIKDDNAPDSIMKLSNIMRYVTDDASEDFVPLQNELDCINDYIELQRQRLGEKTTVNIYFEGNISQKKIAPLILMTFIENIFKYGISKYEKSVIVVTVEAVTSGILFFCENTIFADTNQNNSMGIGLKNTRKRLRHLYPGKHSLNIKNEDGLFTVNLKLQTP
jgi:two-component system, LytTR family, sensor kinase